jgi:RNA polymerase sigma-70 factor (ECF subfamily)
MIAGVERAPAFADEVRQELRDKLFTSPDGEPKIAEYTGRGALGGWVRVSALRIALNLRRSAKRAAAVNERAASMEEALMSGSSPELAYLKERYRAVFTEALEAAVASLSDRDRALLRLYHVDGLSLEAMAALYRVHLSTVSRWLTCPLI